MKATCIIMYKGSHEDLRGHSAETATQIILWWQKKTLLQKQTVDIKKHWLSWRPCCLEFSADDRHVFIVQFDTLCKRCKHSFFFFCCTYKRPS